MHLTTKIVLLADNVLIKTLFLWNFLFTEKKKSLLLFTEKTLSQAFLRGKWEFVFMRNTSTFFYRKTVDRKNILNLSTGKAFWTCRQEKHFDRKTFWNENFLMGKLFGKEKHFNIISVFDMKTFSPQYFWQDKLFLTGKTFGWKNYHLRQEKLFWQKSFLNGELFWWRKHFSPDFFDRDKFWRKTWWCQMGKLFWQENFLTGKKLMGKTFQH